MIAVLASSDDALIIDKPAGLPLDPGRRGGPSLADQLPALRRGRFIPAPAHRLDQDTAGCLVLARHKAAPRDLSARFAARDVQKLYWAVLRGDVAGDTGVVDAPLLKHSTREDGWHMRVDAAGAAAITEWRALGRAPGMTWVEFAPLTGRTHQLRAHAAHLGHPILGDARYGGGAGAMHLLARRLVIAGLDATAPIPPHMQDAIAACGG